MKQATYHLVTLDTVAKIRKDFLSLMAKTDSLKSFEDMRGFEKTCHSWSDIFEGILTQIRIELQSRKSEYSKTRANAEWAENYATHQKDVWSFNFEVRHPPLVPEDEKLVDERDRYNRWQQTKSYGEPLTEEEQFKTWMDKQDFRRWVVRVRAKARDAWKWLERLVAWTMSEGFYGGGGAPIKVQVPSKENTTIEGFRVQVLGWEDEEFQKKGMETFKAGLKFYRDRASLVYPWLIKNQLPLIADFSTTSGRGEGAATYKGTNIEVSFWVIHSDNQRKFAHALAHEMGHHAWRMALSSGARKFWDEVIHGSPTKLDLRAVLKMMHPGEDAYALEKRLETENPILTLQLRSLLYDPAYRDLDLYSLKAIQNYVESGKDPIVRVPLEPITGYASKNENEAFAEVVGMLVGYGPKAVLPAVIERFRMIVPEVRIASAERVAARWELHK